MRWSRRSAEGVRLFEREHHRRIARVLESLDGPLLAANECWFGGGTAMALRFGEYRESVDIDLLVSKREGYRQLRQLLTGPEGVKAISRPGAELQQVRELRADQYGLRTMLRVDGIDIKFEIVLEARIAFDLPGQPDEVCGIRSLTPLDLLASKLLANSDRWRDDSVLCRDLIDMAMMQASKALLQQAIAKAEAAYGDSVRADLQRACEVLRERPQRLEHCMTGMGMSTVPKALLWTHIRTLARRAG